LGTPSYPRGRVVYLVFEDRRVQNISRIKIYRTAINYFLIKFKQLLNIPPLEEANLCTHLLAFVLLLISFKYET